jgi:hypothetical protein
MTLVSITLLLVALFLASLAVLLIVMGGVWLERLQEAQDQAEYRL